MNKIAYPDNYDGYYWNTLPSTQRRFLPKYLCDDLPTLRRNYIRAQFQTISKVNCPNLEYFVHKLKKEKVKTKPKGGDNARLTKLERFQANNLKEELKYALIMADRKSNVTQNIISQINKYDRKVSQNNSQKDEMVQSLRLYSHSEECDKQFQSTKKSHTDKHIGNQRRKSLRMKRHWQQDSQRLTFCFDNTIELVFQHRKRQLLNQIGQQKQIKTIKSIENKIDSIRLLPFKEDPYS